MDITPTIRLLHSWSVTLDQTVKKTTTENVNGAPAQVTRDVVEPVATRFALKHPSRRELRQAELFYGKQYNDFVKMGFLPRSIMVNKHLDISGGVLSEKENAEAKVLIRRHEELEKELKGELTTEAKETITKEMGDIRSRVLSINAANEAAFNQTAEYKARGQFKVWFALFLTVIQRDGRWVPYFQGDTFEQREEFMWQLEETSDALYALAAAPIGDYVDLYFTYGFTEAKQFEAFDKMAAERAAAEAKAKTEEAAKNPPKDETPPSADPEAPIPAS